MRDVAPNLSCRIFHNSSDPSVWGCGQLSSNLTAHFLRKLLICHFMGSWPFLELILRSQFCLGPLSGAVHLRPRFELPGLGFLAKMLWYLEWNSSFCWLTNVPGTLVVKQSHNLKDPPLYFTRSLTFLRTKAPFFECQTHHWCWRPQFWSHLTITPGSNESSALVMPMVAQLSSKSLLL